MKLTNADLEQLVDTDAQWIVERTGIESWGINHMQTTDMAEVAGLHALAAAGLEAADIDLLIMATVTPEISCPSNACHLQTRLGAVNAAAFDLNAACSGFVYAAITASSMIFSAYATINIAFFYIVAQKWRGNVWMSGDMKGNWKWKWALVLLNLGMLGMTMGMLVSGYEQSQIERAIEGSTWAGYFAAQAHPWFIQGMVWREIFGVMFAAGYGILIWDLLTIGKRETRPAQVLLPH